MAVLMSVVFCVPTFYLCSVGGSFFVWWLVYLVSLSDGICAYFSPLILHLNTPALSRRCSACHHSAAYWAAQQS